ncbi:hypothetical protein BDP27DRAFT_1322586, partial [Rhodocollybia butyracea]
MGKRENQKKWKEKAMKDETKAARIRKQNRDATAKYRLTRSTKKAAEVDSENSTLTVRSGPSQLELSLTPGSTPLEYRNDEVGQSRVPSTEYWDVQNRRSFPNPGSFEPIMWGEPSNEHWALFSNYGHRDVQSRSVISHNIYNSWPSDPLAHLVGLQSFFDGGCYAGAAPGYISSTQSIFPAFCHDSSSFLSGESTRPYAPFWKRNPYDPVSDVYDFPLGTRECMDANSLSTTNFILSPKTTQSSPSQPVPTDTGASAV